MSPRLCPYCHGPVRGGAAPCPICGALHHEECWKANDGCAVQFCAGGPQLPYLEVPSTPTAAGRRLTIEFDEVRDPAPVRVGAVSGAPPLAVAPDSARGAGPQQLSRGRRAIPLGVGVLLVGALIAVLVLKGGESRAPVGPSGPPLEAGGDPLKERKADARTRFQIKASRDRARSIAGTAEGAQATYDQGRTVSVQQTQTQQTQTQQTQTQQTQQTQTQQTQTQQTQTQQTQTQQALSPDPTADPGAPTTTVPANGPPPSR